MGSLETLEGWAVPVAFLVAYADQHPTVTILTVAGVLILENVFYRARLSRRLSAVEAKLHDVELRQERELMKAFREREQMHFAPKAASDTGPPS